MSFLYHSPQERKAAELTYTLEYINERGQSIVFSPKTNIILSSTEGLTSTVIQPMITQGVNRVGGALQGQTVQPRNIMCRGTIMGNANAAKKMMLDIILPEVKAKLIYNDTWTIDVIPTTTPEISRHTITASFDFALRAPYPYWKKKAGVASGMAYMQPMFKFPWNLTKPWVFGIRVAPEFTNVYNAGNIPADFTAVFYARSATSNPSLVKATTLEMIKINKEMEAGDRITVNNGANSITAIMSHGSTTTDIFNAIDFDSTFFLLDPGDNILRFDAEGSRDALDVTIFHSVVSAGAYTI